MDPITLIVAALAAGAASGALDTVKDGAKAGVTAAYEKLRGLARKRVAGDQLGQMVLAAHENAPETYAAPRTEDESRGGGSPGPSVAQRPAANEEGRRWCLADGRWDSGGCSEDGRRWFASRGAAGEE